MRPRCQRRSRVTIGASMKLSRIASASGIRISLPRYSAPTTNTIPTRSAVDEVEVAAGLLVTACRQALGQQVWPWRFRPMGYAKNIITKRAVLAFRPPQEK